MCREEKERYIKAKYERKEFLARLPAHQTPAQSLLDSICRYLKHTTTTFKTVIVFKAKASQKKVP